MEKEIFIKEILNSTEGITKVNPNANLLHKIEQRIQEEKKAPLQLIWLVAASIVVLLTINISVLLYQKTSSEENSENSITSNINKSNQLY